MKELKSSASVPRFLIRGIASFCFVAMAILLVPRAHAGRLGADIIALFPKEVGEFAYADLKKARSMPWFPQLQEQMLPDRFRDRCLALRGDRRFHDRSITFIKM